MWCFLIACTLILWAVFGQLLTVWYLLAQIPNFSASVDTVFTVLLGAAAILAFFYVAKSVPWTLRNQAYHDEIGTGQEQKDRIRSNF